jgi:hypothetical protein
MSNDQPTSAALTPRRSKALHSKKLLLLIALAGAIAFGTGSWLLGTFITHVDGQNGTKRIDGVTPIFLIMLMVLGFAASLAWSLKLWRTIDEAARKAHLDAFYWGGPIAWMVIAPLIVLPQKINGFALPLIENLDMNASQIFGLGMGATILATLIGYTVAWLIWWGSKR